MYYHLGSYDDSLYYALGAEELFEPSEKSEYVDTIIAKCIDSYTAKRMEKEDVKIDPRQEGIVNKMFQRCFEDNEFKQALGIAVETRRMDMLRESILKSV